MIDARTRKLLDHVKAIGEALILGEINRHTYIVIEMWNGFDEDIIHKMLNTVLTIVCPQAHFEIEIFGEYTNHQGETFLNVDFTAHNVPHTHARHVAHVLSYLGELLVTVAYGEPYVLTFAPSELRYCFSLKEKAIFRRAVNDWIEAIGVDRKV